MVKFPVCERLFIDCGEVNAAGRIVSHQAYTRGHIRHVIARLRVVHQARLATLIIGIESLRRQHLLNSVLFHDLSLDCLTSLLYELLALLLHSER